MKWSKFRSFPNPENGEYLYAPFGYGVYELFDREVDKHVLFGRGKNVAYRMSSLLPDGSGARNNETKREYVASNLCNIEYRTKACKNEVEAKLEERKLRDIKEKYIFPT